HPPHGRHQPRRAHPQVEVMIRTLTALAWLLASAAAYAQNARPFAAPSAAEGAPVPGAGSLGEVPLALALVLAAIFVAAWLLRRVRGFGRGAGAALDVIADLPLGTKERVVLVRVGKKQLLLGVAPGRVSALHVLEEPVDTE